MANTETMTIHKGLAELKILESRIEKAIANNRYCIANQVTNNKIKGVDIKSIKEDIKADYKSVSDLIKRHEAIKRAITLSNANTDINIAEKTYKVAEAIYMKNHGMDFYKSLLVELHKQYTNETSMCDKVNLGLDKQADDYAVLSLGNKEIASPEDIEKARRQYIDTHTYVLVDPIQIKEKIESLEEMISKFEAEVDSALSVSNAITEIKVEY